VTRISNGSRFGRADRRGFYESYFQRANHPSRPLAFWIRYTAFSPRGRPQDACGELWAIYFDGEANRIVAAREAFPVLDCEFSRERLDVRIGAATLTERSLQGRAASPSCTVEWALSYAGGEPPLLLLPEAFYERGFPKTKSLVGVPQAMFTGTLTVDGATIPIDGWQGSQNHNWGSELAGRYAWGQVAGFDNAPVAFLECATAQIRLGPVWSPRLTFVVLRDEGQEIALNGPLQVLRADGSFGFFTWTFDARSRHVRVSGRIHARASAFAGLMYRNPPGGEKTCLNTKLAGAEVTVERPGRAPRTLTTRHRAAFEILTDRSDHGVPIVA